MHTTLLPLRSIWRVILAAIEGQDGDKSAVQGVGTLTRHHQAIHSKSMHGIHVMVYDP